MFCLIPLELSVRFRSLSFWHGSDHLLTLQDKFWYKIHRQPIHTSLQRLSRAWDRHVSDISSERFLCTCCRGSRIDREGNSTSTACTDLFSQRNINIERRGYLFNTIRTAVGYSKSINGEFKIFSLDLIKFSLSHLRPYCSPSREQEEILCPLDRIWSDGQL